MYCGGFPQLNTQFSHGFPGACPHLAFVSRKGLSRTHSNVSYASVASSHITIANYKDNV